jgi:hypothetical protein
MKSSVELRDLVLTPGVVLTDEAISCAALDLSIPLSLDAARRVALEFGMASEGPRRRTLRGAFRIRYRCARLRDGSARAVAHSVSHYAPSLLPSAVVVAGLILVGALADLPSLIAISLLVVMLVVSVIVHEVGHVLVFRLAAGADAAAHVVVRGLSFSLVRRPLKRTREVVVVLAGPLAPLALAVLTIPLASGGPVLWWSWAVVGAGHALTLLLPVGDGANLRLALSDPVQRGAGAARAGS